VIVMAGTFLSRAPLCDTAALAPALPPVSGEVKAVYCWEMHLGDGSPSVEGIASLTKTSLEGSVLGVRASPTLADERCEFNMELNSDCEVLSSACCSPVLALSRECSALPKTGD